MHKISTATEHAMNLAFLLAEPVRIKNDWGDFGDERMLLHPDLLDDEENALRKKLLHKIRYGLFRGFPSDVAWWKYRMPIDELGSVKYIREDGWILVSKGTRLVREFSKNLRENPSLNEKIIRISQAFEAWITFPEIVLVTSDHVDYYILEGHHRATAYYLSSLKGYSRGDVEVFVWQSDHLDEWIFF